MRTTNVDMAVAEIWPILHDVGTLASCSTRVRQVEELEAGVRWRAVLQVGGGLFRLSAPMDVAIEDEVPLQHIAIVANGQDHAGGSSLQVRASITVRPANESVGGDTTTEHVVELSGSYQLEGGLAGMGASIARRQAVSMVDEFWSNLASTFAARQEATT